MNPYTLLEELRIKNHGKPVHKYFTSEFKVKKPKTAAQLESLIIEMLNLSGGCFVKVSSTGRPIVSESNIKNIFGHEQTSKDVKWIPGTTRKGTADILGVLNGVGVAIEVKFSKSDRMSKEQVEFKNDWIASGGIHIIAKTLEDILTLIR